MPRNTAHDTDGLKLMSLPEQLAMRGFWADRPDEDFNHPDGQIRDTHTTTPSISEAPGSPA